MKPHPDQTAKGLELANLAAFYRDLPKVELHVHMEGAMSAKTLFDLAKKNGVELPVDNIDQLSDWFEFVDFPHFAEVYETASSVLQDAGDIELLARQFVASQAADSIIYSEVTYTALTQLRVSRIPIEEQLAALSAAKAWGEQKYGVSFRVITDFARHDTTPEEAIAYVKALLNYPSRDILAGFGIGGFEPGFPPEMFAESFAIASSDGLQPVVHAGETGSAAYVLSAAEVLGARRIGHGIRAIDDPAVLRRAVELGVTFELCPTSNLRLGIIPSYSKLPLRELNAVGAKLTLNSDDPTMFGTTLSNEYAVIQQEFDLSPADLKAVNIQAAHSAILGEAERVQIERQLLEAWVNVETPSQVS